MGLRREAFVFGRSLALHPRSDLVTLGTAPYGDWTVPAGLLGPEAVCYLAGVGEDVSFDLALIERFGCTVHAFDPVPEAAAHIARAAADEPRYRSHPVGLWSEDTTLRLSEPVLAGYVSRSATDMHGTGGGIELTVRSVSSLMEEHGHHHIDLLKVSAEGAEYEILGHILAEGLDVRALAVEFAQPAPRGAGRDWTGRLMAAGYEPVAADLPPWCWRVAYVRVGSAG